MTEEVRADYKKLGEKYQAKIDAQSIGYAPVSAHDGRKRKVITFYGNSLEGMLSWVKILLTNIMETVLPTKLILQIKFLK